MNYELFERDKKKIFLVDMTKELNPFFSVLTMKGIEKYLKQGKRIGILVNKKWYTPGIICQSCGHVPQCEKCSVSISYHKISWWSTIGLCHICKAQYNVPVRCPSCASAKIKEFGMGTQKVAEYLENEFHIHPMIIESETVNSPNKIAKILDSLCHPDSHFSGEGSNSQKWDSSLRLPAGRQGSEWQHWPQVIIWTSLLCSPIPWYPFDLVVFLNADLGLQIPDYSSAEKNFYFLYEAFAKHKTDQFIVQSFNPDHYSIRNACKMDPQGFYAEDHVFRKANMYPPFGEICIILYKHEIEESLFKKVDTLYKELLYLKEKYWLKDIEIFSTPPLIYKMFGKYRYNIIIKGTQVKEFMDIVYSKLKLASKGFKIDRMAESIV